MSFEDFLKQQKNAESAQTSTYNTKTDQELTDEQKLSGEYQKGHIQFQGIDITIENPKNSIRIGVGDEWRSRQAAHYGYFDGTVGADGDPVDVYVGDQLDSDLVLVVNQHNDETLEFDEHKFLIGFSSIEDALKVFQDSHDVDWYTPRSSVRVGHMMGLKLWLSRPHLHKQPVESYTQWTTLPPQKP